MTGVVLLSTCCRDGGGKGHVSAAALLLAALRRSLASTCRLNGGGGLCREDDVMTELERMEIGWPTDVRHVAHVTFDRFNGFLGLPVEFELGRVPSASASVFGVSAESMQCCYDPKGNSVPTILLLLQERLYMQRGLKAEGIFRINPENSQEEIVREQLNKGIVPDDIDVHCLAGLIKAWFRELPEGVLDSLSPEQVLQCKTEDEFVDLVNMLLPTPAALLNWAINLMADVVEEEELNKMNARNIAMVFAPNMTQMSDPLTALMHAVQVMNMLKSLILKTLREREEVAGEGEYSTYSSSPSSGVDDLESEQDMNMSGELRVITLDDCHLNYNICGHTKRELRNSRGKEDAMAKDIEGRCNLEGDTISTDFSSSDYTAQLIFSGRNVGSGLSISKSKQESVSSSDNESDTEARSSLKCMEDEEVDMMDCKWGTSDQLV